VREPAHAGANQERSPFLAFQAGIFTAADEELWFDMFKHGRLPQSAV
jgi:hypothetical protein